MNISALDENGKAVDWWFAYKLPNLKNPPGKVSTARGNTQGTEYLYCDATSPLLPRRLSSHTKILESGALFNTLQQLHNAAQQNDPNVGWIFYNDEHTKIDKKSILPDDGNFGHTKGVVAFDLGTDSAFWLLHSWPCFPSIELVDPPAPNFGQTFLCITLKDVATLDAIASVFHAQTQPQIIGMSLPKALDPSQYPNLVRLSQDEPPAKVPPGADKPSDTTFTSKGGVTFRLFAKSKDWLKPAAETIQEPKDLYSDLIGPTLKVDLEVETWQDGEPDEDSDLMHTTVDILFIDLKPSLGIDAAWHFTDHDHSKWAVSKDLDLKDETDWVIVADINRVDSQFERGGCGVAFQNKDLAHSLHSIIDMTPPAAIGKLIATDEEKAQSNEKARDAKRAATIAKAPKKAAAKGTVTANAKKASAKKALAKNTTARKPARKKSIGRKLAIKKTVVRKPAARKMVRRNA